MDIFPTIFSGLKVLIIVGKLSLLDAAEVLTTLLATYKISPEVGNTHIEWVLWTEMTFGFFHYEEKLPFKRQSLYIVLRSLLVDVVTMHF